MKYSDTYSSYLIRLAILQEDLGDKIQKVCKKAKEDPCQVTYFQFYETERG